MSRSYHVALIAVARSPLKSWKQINMKREKKINRVTKSATNKINDRKERKKNRQNYDHAIEKLKISKPLLDSEIDAIQKIARGVPPQELEKFFKKLINYPIQLHDLSLLKQMWRAEARRNNRILAMKSRPGRKKRITKKHLQKVIFGQIQTQPEKFYAGSPEDCLERVKNIKNALDNFNAEIKKYAEFNLKFFIALGSDNRKLEPIKLPNDIGYFHWPSTEILKEARCGPPISIDAEDSGVLSMLGYNARIDGPSGAKRRQTLDLLFSGASPIPSTLPPSYIAEWGGAKSAARLRKIAYSIASFARQQKRKGNPSIQAIEKWEGDLAYLKSHYYEPFVSKFNWPTIY
jgi:hypothetical protein